MTKKHEPMEPWEQAYWSNRENQMQQRAPAMPQTIPASQMRNQLMTNIMAQQQQQQGSQAVMLREGHDYYKFIPNPDGFGIAVPLIRHMGKLSQVSGKEFAVIGESRGYLVDNSPVIDLGKANEHPERYLNLVKVRAPFVGDILVHHETVIRVASGPQGKNILKG